MCRALNSPKRRFPARAEGAGLKWTGLQMKLVAFKKFVREQTVQGDVVMMMDAR